MYYVCGDMGFSEKAILPDFKTDLIFLFDSRLTGYTEEDNRVTVTTGMVSGFRRVPLHFRYNGNVEMLGIRFLPYGFAQLFRVPPAEITGFRKLSEVLGDRRYREIMERLQDEPDPGRKFRIIETWLMKILAGACVETSLAVRAINRISSSRGILPLNDICNHSPSEYKQLQRFCHRMLDVSPKFFSRMVRFEHLHQCLQAHPRPDWLSLVANFEFTDQSHLVREIRQFTGLTPNAFLARISSFI